MRQAVPTASESHANRIATQNQTQTQSQGEVPPLTAVSGRAAPKETKTPRRGRAEEQRLVMVALGDYANTHAVPPLDRGLRSIVVQQVGNLLRGGWPLEEIKAQALSIFSQYNLAHGHKLMTQLQRTMELADEKRQADAHDARMKRDRVAPDVAALLPSKAMPETRRRHPNNHRFEWDSSDSCRICGGPPGVHVRPVTGVA
jgi:hypothetical protein